MHSTRFLCRYCQPQVHCHSRIEHITFEKNNFRNSRCSLHMNIGKRERVPVKMKTYTETEMFYWLKSRN